MSITKLQNLKAIHNTVALFTILAIVVVNHKTTKFESNSQRGGVRNRVRFCCCQSQNYKIWKQFTTEKTYNSSVFELLSITKLQNLKAIHNGDWYYLHPLAVVVNHKTTKFESNSQRCSPKISACMSCCQSQNYKIWKQFTTWKVSKSKLYMLLSITKLQNLKAIHNVHLDEKPPHIVVVNHKTTKFESNSQPVVASAVSI